MEFAADFYKNILDNINDGIYFVDASRTITYWNRAAERISGYSASEVVGSCCANDILVHVDDTGCHLCTSVCPLAKTLFDGDSRNGEVFLHHKQGHRVPVTVSISPIKDLEGQIIGAIEIFRDDSKHVIEKQLLDDLKKAASIDMLTDLPNRRLIDLRLRTCIDELHRHDIPFGLIFADIDRFKDINDTHGHKVGDNVLRMVAQTLGNNVRGHDLVGRWGGEEFMLIVSHITERNILKLANKLRMLVENSFFKMKDRKIYVTVTMGAVSARRDDTEESLIARADALLYKGKASGRNCVMSDIPDDIMPLQ